MTTGTGIAPDRRQPPWRSQDRSATIRATAGPGPRPADSDARAYVNFLADEGQARIPEAYPAPTWERLAAIKARYDPTNLFHHNQNIPPTRGDARD